MTSQESQLAELTAKIVEAVPEIMCHHLLTKEVLRRHICTNCGTVYENFHAQPCCGRPITLEDVSIAIKEIGSSDLHDCPDGGRSVGETLWDIWHLGKSLSEQSPETISFLHSLLCK